MKYVLEQTPKYTQAFRKNIEKQMQMPCKHFELQNAMSTTGLSTSCLYRMMLENRSILMKISKNPEEFRGRLGCSPVCKKLISNGADRSLPGSGYLVIRKET